MDHKFGAHVEMVKSSIYVDTEILLEPLKGEGFILCYGENLNLGLVMSHNQSSTTKEKVRPCQVQHKNILDSIKTEYQGGIELLDLVSENIGKTLCQIILLYTNLEEKRVFFSLDRNIYSRETQFSFPKL